MMTAFFCRLRPTIDWLVMVMAATALCLWAVCAIAADARQQALLYPQHHTMPLAPFLDYYIDETLSMDIEEVSSPTRVNAFKPLNLDKLPRVEGIVWLRFVLAPLPAETRSPVYLLDMGQSVPGVPRLYEPVRNELSGAVEWRENTPAQRNILLLPEQESVPLTCYIRIDGLPGPWFSPIIRSPQDAAGNWASLSRTGAILALAVVMLLCLMRGLSENGQWRIWTSLFVGVALWQAFAGMPDVNDNFSMWGLASILLPGIALMLLPHVGRHLMHTPKLSKSIDIQLILLSLPGAVLALLPLVPGWAWLDRWLDLWPLGTILFVPTALGAWIMGLPGSRRFLVGCIIPPIFVGVAILGLDFGLPPNLLAALPLWGVVFSAMLIAATKTPAIGDEKKRAEQTPAKKEDQLENLDIGGEEIINLEHPLDDPNLRLVGAGNLELGRDSQEPAFKNIEIPSDMADANTLCSHDRAREAREIALREPLDEIMREGAALGECSLPPAVRIYAEKMIAASQKIADIIGGTARPSKSAADKNKNIDTFNLQAIMRSVHNAVAPVAENSAISLSWYMPPTIRQSYIGDGQRLEETLRLLLESAVRATTGGIVKFAAKDVSENGEEGHILFTVTDNGHGYPPRDRSSLAVARAWETAGEYDGSAAMDAGPNGARIAFSAHFTPVAENQSPTREPKNVNIVLACDEPQLRKELAGMLTGLDCQICEAPGMAEAIECQSARPGPLLIAGGKLARPSSADMVAEFTRMARESGFSHCSVLAITRDDSQWRLLKPSGFTHAMLVPEDQEILRSTVSDLLNLSGIHKADETALEDEKIQDSVPEESMKTATSDLPTASPVPEDEGQEEIISEAAKLLEPEPENTQDTDKILAAETAPLHVAGDAHKAKPMEPIALGPAPAVEFEQPEKIDKKKIDTDAADFILGFEGPAWLGNEDNDEEVEVGATVVGEETLAAEHKTDGEPSVNPSVNNDAAIAMPQEFPEENHQFSDSAMEMEEGQTNDSPKTILLEPAKEMLTPYSTGDDWVGQPMPIIPPASKPEQPTHGETNSEEDSLVNFIVGVKDGNDDIAPSATKSAYDEAKENARIALAATRKNSAVSSFVNSSVELVTKTLTNAMTTRRQESVKEAMPRETAQPAQKAPQVEIVRTQPVPQAAPPAAPERENVGNGPDVRSDPEVVSLVQNLDKAITEALAAYKNGNDQKVAESAAIIARESQAFGLRLLGRMAQCVERAARAPDHNALGDLLPELANAVERNRITITQKK